MRVLMLSWEYPPRIVGGISPHVYDLSKELAALGVEVHVITKETPKAPAEEVEPSGVHVHRVKLAEEPNDFIHQIQLLNEATEQRCRELLEDWRPEGEPTIFHAHDWLSLDAARELKYEYRLPMLATVHATESGRHGGIHDDTAKYIHEQEYWLTYEAWRVIVCSQFMRTEVERAFDCPHNKVDVIHNGVHPEKFRFDWTEAERAERRAELAEPDESIVMYVGRFVREKGIQVLLNAASAILAERPRTKFVVVGGGDRSRFEQFMRWYGLEDKVLFTGFMASESLYRLYRCADVAVFPSLYEPFGIVALEAMAAGAPVVASDAGGLREVVLHNATGTSHYAGDSASLAWAVLRVLNDPDRAGSLKSGADHRLESDFDWRAIAGQTLATYERIWAEFLDSFWAEETTWNIEIDRPKSPPRERTRPVAPTVRPRIALDPDEALAAGKTEAEES